MPRRVTRDEAMRGLSVLAYLHDAGRIADRDVVVAADNIFIDIGLGYVSLPYLEHEPISAATFLMALTTHLSAGPADQEPFQRVGPYWPFAH
jgi:hypothetical protein